MRCPACETTRLVLTERQSVEIDYCPDCRGVWLDRGELDKLIDRAAAASEVDRSDRAPRREAERYDDDDDWRGEPDEAHPRGRKRRRESFLGEFFDFGG